MPEPIVIKVGGSLYDLPDLGPRLQRFLDALPPEPRLLVPGGGVAADVIRHLDKKHLLGETRAHWLALRALTLNAHFLAGLLPSATVVDRLQWLRPDRAWILDVFPFVEQDEGQPGCLPHTWEATSDAIAARVAVVGRARTLILLKSVTIPPGMGWEEAAEAGWVDSLLPRVLRQASGALEVRAVNLRE